MIRNYFLVAIRNLFKNKLSSFINIVGLSVSIMLAIHLAIFVMYELSYDRFNAKHDRIFRIISDFSMPGQPDSKIAICQGQLPLVINGVIPEVEACIRVYNGGLSTVEYSDKRFNNNQLYFVDSSFFDVFSFRLLSGNPHSDLAARGNLFLSRSLALKIFSSLDVKGKMIKMNKRNYAITGVFEDVPQNSHLQFDMISGLPEVEFLVTGSGNEFYTYVLLQNGINQKAALNKICDKYNELTHRFWKDQNIRSIGHSQALTDIWLHSKNLQYDVQHGDIDNIYVAAILIVFVLLIAILNFINLAVVKAEDRAKEIGLRKMSGALSRNIQQQFIGEALMTVIISMIIGVILVELTQPILNNIIGKKLQLPDSASLTISLVLILISFAVAIISGIYPAIHLSRFHVTRIFKGGSSTGTRTGNISKSLVLFQFTIVIFLFSSLLVLMKQMNFVKEKDLGFDKEQVVDVTDQNGSIYSGYENLKQTLLQNPEILNVSLAQSISSDEMSGQYAGTIEAGESKQSLVKQTRTTYDFIKTFRMKILEGRDFDVNLPTDHHAFIINETAKKELGLPKNALGQRLVLNEDTGILIGVVKDFHFASLHNKIDPLFITLQQPNWGHIYIRLKPGNFHEGLSYIKQTIQKVDSHYIFEYQFVDDYFDRQYKADEKVNAMVLYATVISIIIALMGLVALTSVTTSKRTKEIGIRKVFGASVSALTNILLMDILKWVLVANLVAWPCSYFVMHLWLDNFAYRISFPFFLLFLAGGIATAIAAAAIFFHVMRTATRNPVTSLRYE